MAPACDYVLFLPISTALTVDVGGGGTHRKRGVLRQLLVPNDLFQLIEECLCTPLVPLGQPATMDLSAEFLCSVSLPDLLRSP